MSGGLWRPPDKRKRPRRQPRALPKNRGNGNNRQAYKPQRLSLQARRSAELRRQRRLRHAQIGLGWRVTFEAFDQLARDLDEARVDQLLERFASLDGNVLEALHLNDLPLSPIRVIGATGGAP